jgi:galactokinase
MNLISSYQDMFGDFPTVVARAPGRVNLLGEHVDYNDGPVLPAAINLIVSLAAAPVEEEQFTIASLDLKQQVAFNFASLKHKRDLYDHPLPDWALYPAGVAWSLGEAGFEVKGMRAAFSSDIPIGAGLSSSAAVEVAFAVMWESLGGWSIDRMTMAKLCQKAENAYVGVASGLMDQFASTHGVEGHALYFDTRSLEWFPVPLPTRTSLVIADSGVRRTLAGSEYNDRRAACELAIKLLQKYKPEIHSLRDISPPEFAAYSEYLPEEVRKRAEHVVKEIHRVGTAVTALKKGESRAFGAMMFAGHASLKNLYEVSTLELDALVSIARDLPGCLGARLTGAGFGGCTINLVEEERLEEFMIGLRETYHFQTRQEAEIFDCQAGGKAYTEKP